MRFYSDVLKGKTVVVNAFFTTCTSVCPPMNRNMEKIQEAFGDRVGRDVFLVSITVDPEVDTPRGSKTTRRSFTPAQAGFFLPAKKRISIGHSTNWANMSRRKTITKRFSLLATNRPGLWKKAFGMANVAELVQVVESVVNDKGATK